MRILCFTFPRRLAALYVPPSPIRALASLTLSLWALPFFAQAQQPPASPAPQAAQGVQSGIEPGVLPGAQGSAQSGATGNVLPSTLSPIGPPVGGTAYSLHNLVTTPTISPGALTLLELDGRFSQAVATGGGPTFAQWFADDAVALNNGKPPVQGRGNIAASATWKAADYQLTWSPQGASMGPSNDMGYTWGSYEGRARDSNGQAVTTSGRYITIWRKQTDGQWKITLEASADDPPEAGSCCALPKP